MVDFLRKGFKGGEGKQMEWWVIKSIHKKKKLRGKKGTKKLCQGIKRELAWYALYKHTVALCTLKINNGNNNNHNKSRMYIFFLCVLIN